MGNEDNREQKNVHPYETVLEENASIYSTEEAKTEKQKWASMNKQQRKEYFLSYYALKLLALIAGIIIVIFLIVHFATKQDMALGILAVNADGSNVVAEGPEYFNDFLDENGIDPKKNTVNLNRTMYIDTTSEENIDQTNLETIQTLFVTNSVDVFLADEGFYTAMAGGDYIADLRDYLPQDVLDKYQDDIVYVESYETGKEIAAGIRLNTSENAWIAATGWYDMDEVVVGLSDGMRAPELAVKLLLEILQ